MNRVRIAFILIVSISSLVSVATGAHADPTPPPACQAHLVSVDIVERGPDGAEVARDQPRVALCEGSLGRVTSDAYTLEVRVGAPNAGKAPIEVDLTYRTASRASAGIRAASELPLGKPGEIGQISLGQGRRLTLAATVR